MERRMRWAAGFFVVLFAVAIGAAAYNAGVSQGLASAGAAGARMSPYFGYRPWGFGIFGPLVFVFFWFLLARLVFRGGCGRWYEDGPRAGRMSFEDWHRRAHERMNDESRPRTAGSVRDV
jgi:hypothetical protein